MSEFYIETTNSDGTTDELYQLTCTSNMSVNLSGTATNNPVANRTVVADTYVRQNTVISASGMISNILNYGLSGQVPQRSVQENFKKLEELQQSGVPFTLHFDNNQPAKELCIFDSLTFTKASGMGDAYNVTMTIRQILQSSQIQFKVYDYYQSPSVNNQHSDKLDGSNNSTTKIDKSGAKKILDFITGSSTPTQ